MEQLPKNVRQRLNTAVERAAHPEADLLTAFAEGSLTEPERGGLLKHLAECANCRDVLYLSNPKADSSGGILEAASRRQTDAVTGKVRLLSWPVLRWGALSACAVIVATAVSLRLHRQGGPVAEAPRPAAQVALHDGANRERQTYHTQESDKLAAKIEPETAAPGKIVPRVSANKKKDFDSSGRAPAVLHAEVGTAVPSKNKRDEPVNGMITGNAPPVSTETLAAVPARTPAAVGDELKNQSGQLGSRAPSLPASSEMVITEAQNTEIAAVPSRAKDAKKSTAKEKTATAGAAGGVADSNSESRLDFQPGPLLKSSLMPNLRWSISNNGVLQRSYDYGKTWQLVPLTPSAVFRAVAAVGREVWVGGADGTLYHSQDLGGHWTQVKPVADGQILATEITAIEFTDSHHGKLVTANAEIWTTQDDGQNWQKK
jgi:Photosynthesis system II assembly factor YCF48/Putative zinc-finger